MNKTTSGIVIVAKNKKEHHYLRKEISNHKRTAKKYFALVVGEIDEFGTIQTKIRCNKIRRVNKCFNNEKGKYFKNRNIANRLFLHAYYYSVYDTNNKHMNMFCPLADDLYKQLNKKFKISNNLQNLLKNPKNKFDQLHNKT